MQQMNCQNCGASLEIENQFIRAVTCPACGTSYLVRGSEGLDVAGQSASLADYPSRLSVGAQGKIKGRGFTVLGRIRYMYDAGFWEEWQIGWDDGAPPEWLEEDEGMWTLYRRGRVKAEIPPYEEVRVGATISINNQQVFITEKRQGQVMGSEGQFSSVFPIQGTFGYATGAANDRSVSVNYWEDEIELSIGEDLEHSDVVFQS